jgi:hypothetical protein
MQNNTLLLKKIYFKPPVRSFNLKVRRWITDVNGVIINKNLLPAALQQKMPFFMFGKNDMKGGLRSGLSTLPPLNGWQFLTTFINQSPFSTFNVTGFSGLSQIQGQILSGDIVHVFTDNIVAPNYYAWMVQTNQGGAMGSVFESTQNFNIEYWNYMVDTAFQFDEQIFPVTSDGLGVKHSDGFNPTQFRTTDVLLPNILKMKWPFKIQNELSLGTYMLFECDQIDFAFVFK